MFIITNIHDLISVTNDVIHRSLNLSSFRSCETVALWEFLTTDNFSFFFYFDSLFNLDRSSIVQHYSPMMPRVGCTNSQAITLIKIDCEVFVIHCTCPTNQMQ